LLQVDDETKTGTLVNTYAVAGGDLKDHIKYLYHIVSNFNVIMICIDNAGYQFIDSANESELFIDNKINLKFFDFDSDAEDAEKIKAVKKARNAYNVQDGTIVFKQLFTSKFIRNANEYLQACIDHKKIWFASKTCADGSAFDKTMNRKINVDLVPYESKLDYLEAQDDLVYQTKKQCALVEVKTTAKGTQTFDLPQHLKRSTSANRARKDNYTTLMLANWALKSYYEMMQAPKEENNTFVPIFI